MTNFANFLLNFAKFAISKKWEKIMPLISTNYGKQMIETQEVEKVGTKWNMILRSEIYTT